VDKVDSFQQDGHTYHKVDRSLLPDTYMNEYIYDDSKDFAARTVNVDETTVTLMDLGYDRLMQQSCWGIQPINLQQAFAMQSLMDPEVDLSILLQQDHRDTLHTSRGRGHRLSARNRRGEDDALDELDQR
jgi:PhoH-like ATPase